MSSERLELEGHDPNSREFSRVPEFQAERFILSHPSFY